jgi:hemoglobin/transferrin/lactoferrin receptor protein
MPTPFVTGSRVLHAAVAGLLALVSCPAHVAAADAPARPGRDLELETVTVYARRLTPIAEIAATVTVVDQARIETIQAADLRDIVRYEPGLTVRNDPFRFGLDTISIRGLGGNRVAIEIDDIPAAGGFAVGSYADSGRAFVDPAFLRRVEFLRGPASSLYGSDAIGGIVAMTTLAPADLRQGSGNLAARTAAGYASEDEGWHASALVADAAGPAEWLVGYVRREGHEPDNAAGAQPGPRDYTSDSLLAKLVMPEIPGGPVTLAFDGGRIEQQTAVDAFLGVGRFVNTTALEGDDAMRRQRVSLDQAVGARGPWFDGAEWRVYWQGTATDQDTFELRRAVPPRTPAVQLDRSFDFDETTAGLEFTAERTFDTGDWEHGLVYGLEATSSRIEEKRDGLQTTIATGETTNVILGETFPLRDLPLTDVTEVGVFAQDAIRPGADGRWSVIPALRVDWYELEPEVDAMYRADNPEQTPVGVDELSFAPKLGATYRFTPEVTGFFQYAHGFRSPPPADVNIGLEVPLFRVRAVPNPDLEPETSDGFELGLRLQNRTVTLGASVFRTDYRDFIESKVNIGVDPVSGYTLFQSRNVAEARIVGFEMDARLDAAVLAPSLQGWTGRFAASWVRGDDLTRDEPLNSIDPPQAVLGARYEAASARWAVELVLTAVEAQRRVDESAADLYQTDGYATVDLLGQWRVSDRVRLDVGLFNVTDAEYIEWADVRGRAADDVLVPYYTRPGFNASATLRYDF